MDNIKDEPVSYTHLLTQILEEADKGAGDGLAYKDYLRMLLAVGDKEKYPMRAIDMIEGQLRQRAEMCIRDRIKTALPQQFWRPGGLSGTAFVGRTGGLCEKTGEGRTR